MSQAATITRLQAQFVDINKMPRETRKELLNPNRYCAPADEVSLFTRGAASSVALRGAMGNRDDGRSVQTGVEEIERKALRGDGLDPTTRRCSPR